MTYKLRFRDILGAPTCIASDTCSPTASRSWPWPRRPRSNTPTSSRRTISTRWRTIRSRAARFARRSGCWLAHRHWAYAQELRKRYPGIQVEEDRIYVIDGPVWTSAGMTAGMDLALAMVEKDLGADVARSVAHKLVMHQRRSGGQTQHSEMLELSP